jgi:hypothetical protein
MTKRFCNWLLMCVCVLGATIAVRAADDPFLGEWELTIPEHALGLWQR